MHKKEPQATQRLRLFSFYKEQAHMRFFLFLISFVLLTAITACGGKSSDAPAEVSDSASIAQAAERLYLLRAQGHFDEYVKAMKSADGTTEAYQQRLIGLLRHNHAMITKRRGGVKSAHTLRHELSDSGRTANVFLEITYADETTDEILFPLVRDGETWRVR